MENGTTGGRGQNGNCNNLAWDIWELGTSRFDWSSSTNSSFHQGDTIAAPATVTAAAATHPLMLAHLTTSIYAGAGSHFHPDPHLMCLNLDKRHYFKDAATAAATHLGDRSHVGTKRGRPPNYGGGAVGPSPTSAAVPRCQVDGCPVALGSAKEYHRRHKVCEMHDKAAKAVVHGVEQRFCQQCSRFHAVTEFDDSKRSCRRRLAGHNERRRKGSLDSMARNPFQGRAHSLLSSKSNSWLSSADLSSRCSAALRELIAENRAAILSQQVVLDGGDWHQHHHTMEEVINGTQPGSGSPVTSSHHCQIFPEPQGWDQFNGGGGGHVMLDLMQAPSSAFGFLSVRAKSKEEEDECSELWRSLGGGGGHVV